MMKLETRPTDSLKPYEGNPRKNAKAVDAVAASIEQFGFRQPIVIDANGVVVVGHTRLLAARKLGIDKVPVHVAADLTPAQARAYRIADNKTNELAEWDDEALAAELGAMADVDWKALGFTGNELDRHLNESQNDKNGDFVGPLKFKVIVDCDDESQQLKLLERLGGDGYICQALML